MSNNIGDEVEIDGKVYEIVDKSTQTFEDGSIVENYSYAAVN